MRYYAFACLVALIPALSIAQDTDVEFDFDAIEQSALPDIAADELRTVSGSGAVLKGLDKVSGDVADLSIVVGESGSVGRLKVTLGECRFPEDNPSGEAYAWIEINDTLRERVVFEGWMIASSPALNALDHARYDVWVIRCTNA